MHKLINLYYKKTQVMIGGNYMIERTFHALGGAFGLPDSPFFNVAI